MRVLQVIPAMESSAGAEMSLQAVDPILVRSGIEIHLAVLTPHQNLLPPLKEAGVVCHDLSGASFIGRPGRIAALSRRIRPDLVHASLLQAALPCQAMSPFLRASLLVTWANTPLVTGETSTAAWKIRVVQAADISAAALSPCRFHAVTAGVARTMSAALHVRPDRVRVAERGRDPSRYKPLDPGRRAEVRASLDVASDEVLVLAVGRQEPQKDYPLLLRAFADAASAAPMRLLVAGRTGSSTAEIERVLATVGSADRVQLLGQREDVPELMAAADIVVCSSRREGAAGSLIEAMGTGTAVLSVRLDGLEGVLVHGSNAWVVPRHDLASGMCRLASDPELRRRLAEAGRRTFLERFTVERSAGALAETYRWAARSGSHRGQISPSNSA